MSLENGTRVELLEETYGLEVGTLGNICPEIGGPYSVSEPGDVSVVFDGTSHTSSLQPDLLKIIGGDETVCDPISCGSGKGKECCIFLTCGTLGFECQRFGSLRTSLIFKKMSAERHPSKPFPDCQL